LVLQKWKHGLRENQVLDYGDMEALMDAVPGVEMVLQHHRQRVSVPAGMAHSVTNLLPNAKMAMEGAVADMFPAYVHAAREVFVPWFAGTSEVRDYGLMQARIFSYLIQAAAGHL
jgi:hypothetical protein